MVDMIQDVSTTVRISKKYSELLEYIAKYLYETGRIQEKSKIKALEFCIDMVRQAIVQEISDRRKT